MEDCYFFYPLKMKNMKKIISIAVMVFLLVAMSAPLRAQSTFSFGIKAGINFSNYISKSTMKPGGEAGIFFRGGKRFYIEPSVMYSFRSTSFKDFKEEIQASFEVGQHFIDVPILLGFKAVNNPNFNFRIFLGPRVGFRVGSDYDNFDDAVGYAQWGGQAGIGIDFWRFTLDVKYDISASKFKEYDEKTFWKQNLVYINLGFKFKK